MRGRGEVEEVELAEPAPSLSPRPVSRRAHRAHGPMGWLTVGVGLVVTGAVVASPVPARTAVTATPPAAAPTYTLYDIGDGDAHASSIWAGGTRVTLSPTYPDHEDAQLTRLLAILEQLDDARTWECGPAPDAAAWTQCTTVDSGERQSVILQPPGPHTTGG